LWTIEELLFEIERVATKEERLVLRAVLERLAAIEKPAEKQVRDGHVPAGRGNGRERALRGLLKHA
jgi:hypothetical protein